MSKDSNGAFQDITEDVLNEIFGGEAWRSISAMGSCYNNGGCDSGAQVEGRGDVGIVRLWDLSYDH